MLATLPLEKMSMTDKISTMEMLWDDISHNAKDYPSPEWHGDVLKQREEMIATGKAKFEDWEKVKKELWNDLT